MKQVVSISLGASEKDYAFNTEFLGQDFTIRRLGTDGDLEKAAKLLLRMDKEADAIGPHSSDGKFLPQKFGIESIVLVA